MTPVNECSICKHWRSVEPGNLTSFCAAFPDGNGVPWAIQVSQKRHREPVEGDHGIQFEPKPGTERFVEA